MLTSVKQEKKKLPELVADQIAALVADQYYKSGDKLPNEFEMAKELQVGRGTIREAVKILASRQIVEIRRGCGTFVCSHPGRMEDPLGLSFVENKRKLALDLYETRMILEPQIAALAAQRADGEDLKKLWAAEENVRKLCQAGEDYTREDIKFHEQLARCSHNQVMRRLTPVIQSSVSVFIEITNSRLREKTLYDHEAIVRAIEAKDKEKAAEAVRRHLKTTGEYIVNMARETPEEKMPEILRETPEKKI